MDSEYTRLTGVTIDRFKIDNTVNTVDSDVISKVNLISPKLLGKSIYGFSEFINNLDKKGLCKINNNKTSVYDLNGNWVCRFEEYIDDMEFISDVLTKIFKSLGSEKLNLVDNLIVDCISLNDKNSLSLFDL
jgi:hypothetical protein